MQHHRRQPTRLPHPWDSLGKNTGVGYHFLLQCMKVKSESEVAQSCPTLHDPMDCSLPGSSAHKIFQASVLEWVAIAFSPLYDYMIVNKFLLLLMDICFFQLWALRNNSFFFLFFLLCVFLKVCPMFKRRRQWQPKVLLPGKSHGWRRLVGCSP